MRNVFIILCLVLVGCQEDVPLYGSEVDIIEIVDASSSSESIEDVLVIVDVSETVALDVPEPGPDLPDRTKKDVKRGDDLQEVQEVQEVQEEVEAPPPEGCTDALACNYSAEAEVDDGSCEYPLENYDCFENCLLETDCSGICGGLLEIDGCGVCGGLGPIYCTDGGVDVDCDEVDVYLKLENFLKNSTGLWGVDVMVSFEKEIWGYQFNLEPEEIITYEEGLTEQYNFYGANSKWMIVALTLAINPILSEGRDFALLTKVYGQGLATEEVCVVNPILATGPDPAVTPPDFGLITGVCNLCTGL